MSLPPACPVAELLARVRGKAPEVESFLALRGPKTYNVFLFQHPKLDPLTCTFSAFTGPWPLGHSSWGP